MADPNEKNWWERNVEDSWEESAKREHKMLEGNPVAQAQSDIGYGIQRGTYEFGKGLALGIMDLAKLTYNLRTGDQETYDKIWNTTKKVAKEAYIAEFGSPEEKRDQNERAWAAMSGVGKGVKEEMGKQWDQAAKEGRQAALISRWVTEGVLNIAAFFVGAEEVKAAASAAKTAEALEGAEAATVIIKCPKQLAAEQAANAKKFADWEAAQKAAAAAKAAAEAEKAAEAARAAETARLAEAAGKPQEPWLIRDGEGKFPATGKVAKHGSPMKLDPKVSKTYLYVVKEDGSICYAPQKLVRTSEGTLAETVKHTDLAEAGPARVSGEIKYNEATRTWEMDAESGRYSATPVDPNNPRSRLRGTRSQENVEAAAELARNSGTTDKIIAKPSD